MIILLIIGVIILLIKWIIFVSHWLNCKIITSWLNNSGLNPFILLIFFKVLTLNHQIMWWRILLVHWDLLLLLFSLKIILRLSIICAIFRTHDLPGIRIILWSILLGLEIIRCWSNFLPTFNLLFKGRSLLGDSLLEHRVLLLLLSILILQLINLGLQLLNVLLILIGFVWVHPLVNFVLFSKSVYLVV